MFVNSRTCSLLGDDILKSLKDTEIAASVSRSPSHCCGPSSANPAGCLCSHPVYPGSQGLPREHKHSS